MTRPSTTFLDHLNARGKPPAPPKPVFNTPVALDHYRPGPKFGAPTSATLAKLAQADTAEKIAEARNACVFNPITRAYLVALEGDDPRLAFDAAEKITDRLEGKATSRVAIEDDSASSLVKIALAARQALGLPAPDPPIDAESVEEIEPNAAS